MGVPPVLKGKFNHAYVMIYGLQQISKICLLIMLILLHPLIMFIHKHTISFYQI